MGKASGGAGGPIAAAESTAAWDGEEGDRWAEQAEHYEASTRPHGRLMLAAAHVSSGDRVLDIG